MKSLAQIQKEIEDVIQYSQDYPFRVDAGQIVRQWYENKRFYIDRMGGETRIKLDAPISVEVTGKGKKDMFNKFIAELDRTDGNLLSAHPMGSDVNLYDFLTLNEQGFFDNRVIKGIPELKITPDMKLLKCFKYFIRDFEDCRWAQDMASRYIQGTKVKGYLYLSVDPLDFLTVSENNNNWRSCHALDGEYRAGNINYMVDDTTLVAYLASEKDENLRAFPPSLKWNNKKWRMLVHTNHFQSVIYYNRQYPFTCEQLLNHTYSFLNSTMVNADSRQKEFYSPIDFRGFSHVKTFGCEDVELEYNFIIGERSRVYDTREIIDESGSMGYTDLCYSPHYTPIYSMRLDVERRYRDKVYDTKTFKEWDDAFHEAFDISIGKAYKCLKCGEADIKRNDSFLCEDCIALEDADEDLFCSCAYCGRRLYDDDPTFDSPEGVICETCHDADVSLDQQLENNEEFRRINFPPITTTFVSSGDPIIFPYVQADLTGQFHF